MKNHRKKLEKNTLNVSNLFSSELVFTQVLGITLMKHLGNILINRNSRFTNGPYVLYKDTAKIMKRKPIDRMEDIIIRFVNGFENMLFVF